ncbi:MAG TPA: alpha/beta hydrolase [Dehalococcoidia bacterium]|nr:alpha/beta hydrolase [Dehalococcoidia bacterium]
MSDRDLHPASARWLLIHGAANSARVWTHWRQMLAADDIDARAIDLRGHGDAPPCDLSRTSMRDYADDAAAEARKLGRPVVVGWSMGGLIALMLAAEGLATACIALAPSVPARERDASVALREGEFGPEEYGITSRDPHDQPAMPDLDREERAIALASLCDESRYARDDRQAGIVIERLRCQLLIVTGSADAQWPRTRYDGLWLPADWLTAEGASHWGLVLNRRALRTLVPQAVAWARRSTSSRAHGERE